MLLQKTWIQSPSSTLGDSQVSVTPAPGYPVSSSGLHQHLHLHGVHSHKHINKNKSKNNFCIKNYYSFTT